jgi:hypothetical protein
MSFHCTHTTPAYIQRQPSTVTVPLQTPPRGLQHPCPSRAPLPHPLIIIILSSPPPPHPQGAWPTTATLLHSYSNLLSLKLSGPGHGKPVARRQTDRARPLSPAARRLISNSRVTLSAPGISRVPTASRPKSRDRTGQDILESRA